MVPVLAICILAGGSSAEEDRYFVFGEPLQDVNVMYAGDEFQFSVEFENDWSYWAVEFSSWLFATWRPMEADAPVEPGDTFEFLEWANSRELEGEYPVSMSVTRARGGGEPEVVNTTFTMDYRYALNVTDFYIRRESSGLVVVLELDLHIPMDVIEADLHAEGGNFEVQPDVVVVRDLPAGPTVIEADIVLFEAQNGPPQIIMYDLVCRSGAHVISMEATVDDPEFRKDSSPVSPVLVVAVVVVAVIASYLYHRRRRRGRAKQESGRDESSR